MKKILLRQIILASLLAAMTTVLTYYIKIPSMNGYIHIGDSVIYLAACLLPTPLAMLTGAIGGMAADFLGGYTVYAVHTFIIKSLIAVAFSNNAKKIVNKRNVSATGIGLIITSVGYYIAEAVNIAAASSSGLESFKDAFFSPVPWSASLATFPGNVIQAVASAIVFFVLGTALDKAQVKRIISK